MSDCYECEKFNNNEPCDDHFCEQDIARIKTRIWQKAYDRLTWLPAVNEPVIKLSDLEQIIEQM